MGWRMITAPPGGTAWITTCCGELGWRAQGRVLRSSLFWGFGCLTLAEITHARWARQSFAACQLATWSVFGHKGTAMKITLNGFAGKTHTDLPAWVVLAATYNRSS